MKRGFTLIELIIVVIVIGILAAIALPQFFRVAERARAAEMVTAIGAIRSAQMRYFSEHGRTGTLAQIDTDISAADSRYIWTLYAYPHRNIRTTPTTWVAYALRNLVDNPYGYYYLLMWANGDIVCYGNADGCRAAGY